MLVCTSQSARALTAGLIVWLVSMIAARPAAADSAPPPEADAAADAAPPSDADAEPATEAEPAADVQPDPDAAVDPDERPEAQPEPPPTEARTKATFDSSAAQRSAQDGPPATIIAADPPPAPDTEKADEPKTFGVPKGEGEALEKARVKSDKIQYVPGKGLEFESKDERHKMQIRLRGQVLYSLANESGAPPATEHSFQLRRARLQFGGNMFGKHNKYKVEIAISPRDIGLDRGDGTIARSPLLDWYFEFDQIESFTIRAGQSKIPFSRQRVMSSGVLELVDRSIANNEFNLDRDIGIDARSKDFLGLGLLRYYLGVYTGEGHSSFEQSDLGMNYLGRIEVLPFGMFEDYDEGDLERLLQPRLSIGASYAYIDRAKRLQGILGSTAADSGTTDYHNVEADFIFMWAGWSVFGEAFYRTGKRNPGSLIDDAGDPILDDAGDPLTVTLPRNGYGWMLQSGLMIPKTRLQAVARYAQVDGVGNRSSLSRRDEVGAGPSYYFAHHNFKLQADYFRLFDEGAIDEGEHLVRVQFQGSF